VDGWLLTFARNMDKAKTLEKILELQLGWVRAADTRLSLVIPLATAMLTALAALSPMPTEWTACTAIIFALTSIFLILSIVFSSLAFFPRTEGPEGSYVFFGGIASRKREEYLKVISELTEEDYISDLSSQCHRNAEIAGIKYGWAQKAIASLLVAILPWLFTVYSLYIS